VCEFCDYRARNPGNLNSHVKAVLKLQDFTIGKMDNIFIKKLITNRILNQDQKKIENGTQTVDCSSVLTDVVGNIESEDFMDSL